MKADIYTNAETGNDLPDGRLARKKQRLEDLKQIYTECLLDTQKSENEN